ncbi:fibronectin type III domain-containing protein [Fontivita pretiosa]|uniref:fibronectin type III domain-containing protein n=1 Tax=Fontivita pretiosa TaxID=2989684 RepID=UPI003D16457D
MSKPKKSVVRIDSLERRTLLSSTLINGTLTLTSVVLGEEYFVDATGGTVRVDIMGENLHFTYPTGSVRRLVINSRAGGDNNHPGDKITVTSAVTFPTTITGSIGDDTIFAGSGNTSISGGDGADYIVGGSGTDTIYGGNGRPQRDQVPAADDTILGGAGNDLLLGEGSPDPDNLGDIIIGQAGNDTIIGGEGADIMDGGDGIDVLSYQDKGGDGVDVRFFANGGGFNPNYNAAINPDYDPTEPLTASNYPYRGFGEVTEQDNVFVVDEHDNLFAGLAEFIAGLPVDPLLGRPVFSYTTILGRFDLLNNDNFEQFWGSPSTDLFDVSIKTRAYTLLGGDGVDTLRGGSANDLLNCGPNEGVGRGGVNGFDIGVGGPGNDTIIGESGSDDLNGGTGNDEISGGDGFDLLSGDAGDDRIDGGNGNDLLIGDSGDGSHDTTSAGGGNDTLLGGADENGADTLQGDGGWDVADYSMRTTGIRLRFDIEHDDGNPTINGGSGERDLVTESVEEAIGGAGNDVLDTGGDGMGRKINGGAGNDTLVSGLGPDTIIGGSGTDSVDYSARTNPVVVTPDGLANDGDPTLDNGGPPGENDNVDASVERTITRSGTEGPEVPRAPLPPSELVAMALSYDRIELNWRDNSTNEIGFTIFRKQTASGRWQQVASTRANVRSYTVSGLIPETKYYFRVRAFNNVGDSLDSNLASATTRSAALRMPSNLRATAVSSSRIDLSWSDNSDNETGFEIWRQAPGELGFRKLVTVNAGTTTYQNTGLQPNSTYSYQVRAINAYRSSSLTSSVSATTKPADFIVAPSGLSASTRDDGSVVLRWQDNSTNETQFAIERRLHPDGLFAQIATVGAGVNTYTDTTVDPELLYDYRVRGLNATSASEYSNIATSNLRRALVGPTRVEALPISSHQILVTWLDNSAVETGFVIERRDGRRGEFVAIAQPPANTTRYLDSGLMESATYYYRVRAVAGTAVSSFGNTARATTLPQFVQLPATPSAFKARAINGNAARLWWQDNAIDETGYHVERAESIHGPFHVIAQLPEDSNGYIDEGLVAGQRYYYRVRAVSQQAQSLPTRVIAVTPPPMLKVGVFASDPVGSEDGDVIGFVFRRQGGDRSVPLEVPFVLGGTARNGVDYQTLQTTATIPAGRTGVEIFVIPIRDAEDEPTETVTITLARTNLFKISPNNAAASAEIANVAPAAAPRRVFSLQPLAEDDDQRDLPLLS